MKGSRSQTNMQNKQFIGHRPQPDIRDDLDSRKNEEQLSKGDDETNNEQEVRSDNKMRKRNGSRK
jgi:hypothetical protein